MTDRSPPPLTDDPVADMLLRGDADTVAQAETLYLDTHLFEIIDLVQSSLSDEQFRAHPLVMLLMAHGSRGWEDSLL